MAVFTLASATKREDIMKQIRPGAYFLILLLVIAVVALAYGSSFPTMKSKLVPIISAGVILILGLVELRKELLSVAKDKKEATAEAENAKVGTEHELRRYLQMGGWMVALAAGIYVLGFLIAVPLFIITYLKLNNRGWLISIGVAGAMEAFIYGVFVFGLRIDLYPGVIFGGYLW